MRTGRTIGAERERVATESERLALREKNRRRKAMSVATFFMVVLVLVLGTVVLVSGWRSSSEADSESSEQASLAPSSAVEVVDEASVGISRRVLEFLAYVESDLAGYGYRLTRAVLPRDKTREVDVYLEGVEGYFKLSLDRGAGVSAEDVDRMVRYLRGLGFAGAEYVDLRVAGKGYYKGAVSAPVEVPVEVTPVEEAPVEAVPEEVITEVVTEAEEYFEEGITGVESGE